MYGGEDGVVFGVRLGIERDGWERVKEIAENEGI